jgi:hypothetical protein
MTFQRNFLAEVETPMLSSASFDSTRAYVNMEQECRGGYIIISIAGKCLTFVDCGKQITFPYLEAKSFSVERLDPMTGIYASQTQNIYFGMK